MELPKLKPLRATDEVYAALRQAILSHVFKAGQRLLIEDIASKLGVSLTPVRHAIQQLAAEGLVEVRPRSGTFVASLSARDVEETFQIRCALECLAGELAVERITPEQIERMSSIIGELAQPVLGEEDRKRHEEANLRLHRLLVEASGNKRLAEMYESLRAHMQIARVHSSESDWQSRLSQEQSEHEEIFQSLKARDKARLVEALRTHIGRAKDDLTGSLQKGEPA